MVNIPSIIIYTLSMNGDGLGINIHHIIGLSFFSLDLLPKIIHIHNLIMRQTIIDNISTIGN